MTPADQGASTADAVRSTGAGGVGTSAWLAWLSA